MSTRNMETTPPTRESQKRFSTHSDTPAKLIEKLFERYVKPQIREILAPPADSLDVDVDEDSAVQDPPASSPKGEKLQDEMQKINTEIQKIEKDINMKLKPLRDKQLALQKKKDAIQKNIDRENKNN